jgi:hypothetical protein
MSGAYTGGFPDEAKFYGREPTATEKDSGEQVYEDNRGPLRPGGNGHRALTVWADGMRRTAYEMSKILSGDPHRYRREAERLLTRGFLRKEGTKSNIGVTPGGRDHVDAFVISAAGILELRRLNEAAKDK